MSEEAAARLLSGELWESLCEELRAAGRELLADSVPGDPLTRAEGFRYLTRLLRLSLEKHIEFANPDFPQFYSLSHETAKIGNDNPDNYYLNCEVRGDRDYRITGNRGTVAYLSIESKAGSFAGGGDMAPTGHIELAELEVDDRGDFEIIASATPHEGNWLPMTTATDNLLVRQTFRDRATEQRAEMNIQCLNPSGHAALEPEAFAQQLERVVPFVSGTAGLFRGWMEGFARHINQLPPNDQAMCLRSGGDPAIYYHNSYWRLDPEEALVIEFKPPEPCRTWNFQLSNFWMESLDYRYHRISVNRDTAYREPDGTVRIVISRLEGDTPAGNWLATAGHREGGMLLRYVDAQTFPPVATRVVPLNTLLP